MAMKSNMAVNKGYALATIFALILTTITIYMVLLGRVGDGQAQARDFYHSRLTLDLAESAITMAIHDLGRGAANEGHETDMGAFGGYQGYLSYQIDEIEGGGLAITGTGLLRGRDGKTTKKRSVRVEGSRSGGTFVVDKYTDHAE